MSKRNVMVWVVMGLVLVAAGCSEELDGPLGPGGGGAIPDEFWPGGSVGGWESGEGVEEFTTRGEGRSVSDDDDYFGEADDSAAPSADGEEFAPDGDANNGGALEGGEIDDNEDFEQFLAYADAELETFAEEPMIHWLDVSRRHIIEVVDGAGAAVPDALVVLLDGSEVVAAGRSHGDGRYMFFPHAYGSQADDFTVEVYAGQGVAEAALGVEDAALSVPVSGAGALTACQVDVAFLIDATGSMGGEINRIKDTITSIAGRISDDPEHSADLRLGLVDYRDRGDAYITHAVNFTRDVQAFQGAIDQLQAGGGGDFPEGLNEALHEGMRRLAWRQESTLRLAFVVADAPAHYYEDAQYTYDDAMKDAATMGVTLYPIASGGSDGVAELQFRQMAQFSQGHFIFITRGNGSSEGSEGSEYEVDPEDFDVQQLDDLVVRLIQGDVADWCAGVQRPL